MAMVVVLDEKVRENRLRRTAARRGFLIEKSRIRDPKAIGYGLWRVWREGSSYDQALVCVTLDDVEAVLDQ